MDSYAAFCYLEVILPRKTQMEIEVSYVQPDKCFFLTFEQKYFAHLQFVCSKSTGVTKLHWVTLQTSLSQKPNKCY